MSATDHLSVSRNDGESLEVSLGSSSIIISELRVRLWSNFATPYLVLGKGGARLLLTSNQFLKLICEFARFTLSSAQDAFEGVSYVDNGVNFKSSITKEKEYNGHKEANSHKEAKEAHAQGAGCNS